MKEHTLESKVTSWYCYTLYRKGKKLTLDFSFGLGSQVTTFNTMRKARRLIRKLTK